MTDIQKKKINIWLEFIPKGITPILLIGIIWKGGIWFNESQNQIASRGFDSPLQKERVVNHVENALSELRIYKMQVKTDSILNALALELEEKKSVKSIAEKNTIQIYQIKKNQETTLRKLDEIIRKQ